jgi:hypothetical protein
MQTTSSKQAELARFKRDMTHYEVHRDELAARYPEEWIAIYDEIVVGAAAELEDLLAALRQRHVPPEEALVKHLAGDEDLLILPARSLERQLRTVASLSLRP